MIKGIAKKDYYDYTKSFDLLPLNTCIEDTTINSNIAILPHCIKSDKKIVLNDTIDNKLPTTDNTAPKIVLVDPKSDVKVSEKGVIEKTVNKIVEIIKDKIDDKNQTNISTDKIVSKIIDTSINSINKELKVNDMVKQPSDAVKSTNIIMQECSKISPIELADKSIDEIVKRLDMLLNKILGKVDKEIKLIDDKALVKDIVIKAVIDTQPKTDIITKVAEKTVDIVKEVVAIKTDLKETKIADKIVDKVADKIDSVPVIDKKVADKIIATIPAIVSTSVKSDDKIIVGNVPPTVGAPAVPNQVKTVSTELVQKMGETPVIPSVDKAVVLPSVIPSVDKSVIPSVDKTIIKTDDKTVVKSTIVQTADNTLSSTTTVTKDQVDVVKKNIVEKFNNKISTITGREGFFNFTIKDIIEFLDTKVDPTIAKVADSIIKTEVTKQVANTLPPNTVAKKVVSSPTSELKTTPLVPAKVVEQTVIKTPVSVNQKLVLKLQLDNPLTADQKKIAVELLSPLISSQIVSKILQDAIVNVLIKDNNKDIEVQIETPSLDSYSTNEVLLKDVQNVVLKTVNKVAEPKINITMYIFLFILVGYYFMK